MKFEDFHGLGKKRAEALKAAGYDRPESLLSFLPVDYAELDVRSLPQDGEKRGFVARVLKVSGNYASGGRYIVRADLETADGVSLKAVWFNQKYIKALLNIGETYLFFGRVKIGELITIASPKIVKRGVYRGIVPIYASIKGVPAKLVDTLISAALSETFVEPSDALFGPETGLMARPQAIKELHRPTSTENLKRAESSFTLKFLSLKICEYSLFKRKNGAKRRFVYDAGEDFLSRASSPLPFALTDGQINALGEILTDMRGGTTMNRLLNGDVGSGKTVVAFIVMLLAALSGFQTVLMAPTELLARQHFARAVKYFAAHDIGVCRLTGALSRAQRAETLASAADGSAKVIIATHAALSDDVSFARLALIVIDEQQRFGVGQRGALEHKSPACDVLVMSATPIPRTLALTLYGSLGRSVLRGRTKGRVTTRFVPSVKRGAMMAYLIQRAADDKRSYVVCSRIEEDGELAGAEQIYRELKKRTSYAGLVHGRMSDAEKEEAMAAFDSGKTRILVSTTVVEVGIDIPEATDIVVFDADRYGLSQLHQLRGRVGRGDEEGRCFILSDNENAFETRLKFFCHCQDGFELAEYDFKTRGAGDFLGLRQHGRSLTVGEFVTAETIEKAAAIARTIMADESKTEIIESVVEDRGLDRLTLN